MKTIELFRENVYLKEASAKVINVSGFKGDTIIELDQTIFFPEGGGQSCDVGFINDYKVIEVYELNKSIYHKINGLNSNINVGDIVSLKLDFDRRFDNMQRHCGEHILTGVIDRDYGGVNRGFHMGDEYMTIDISMEKNESYNTFTYEMAKKAELKANEIIYQNFPMLIKHYDTREEAEKRPMRKALTIEEDIILVGFGSEEYGWSCVACCGTHPKTTAEVGMIKVYKVENNKGMYRIYFEAGKRAFINYQNEFDILNRINNKLSTSTKDLIKSIESQQEKNNEARSHLHNLTKYTIELESKILLDLEYDTYKTIIRKDYDALNVNDLLGIGRNICGSLDKVLALVHKTSNTVVLLSNGQNVNCGKLVKENANIYNGKGGGSNISARAIFSKKDDLDMFLKLIDLQISHI